VVSKLKQQHQEKGSAMGILQIRVQCFDKCFEVFSDEVVDTELVVENAVSQVLLDLFDGVMIDEVTICSRSNLYRGLRQCFILMQAQCACQSFTLLPRTKEHIERVVAKSICSILRELFGSVTVERVMFTLSPWEYEQDHMIASSI
jgi:hypothetical protein